MIIIYYIRYISNHHHHDIALITDSEAALQEAVFVVDESFRKWGLIISVKKSKVLHMQIRGIQSDDPLTITLRGTEIENVHSFKYLGSIYSANLSMQAEVSQRLASAGRAFYKLSCMKLWKDYVISMKTKITLYKVMVQSVLLYGSETWALTEQETNRLEVFQMRCLRRIKGITLLDRQHNEDIRSSMEIPKIGDVISYRRLRWLGHIGRMTEDRMPQQLLFSKFEGEQGRGRPLKTWSDYVRKDLEDLQILYCWWRKCQDREHWRKTIDQLLHRT